MSTPWAQSATLSSAALVSNAIALDPLAKMTAVQLSVTGTSSAAISNFFVQATLDTPAFSPAGGILPQPQPIWSVVGPSSVAFTFSSGVGGGLTAFDNTTMFVLLQPVAGLRLISSAAINNATVQLRALQSPAA
jgi:hypothetical protein